MDAQELRNALPQYTGFDTPYHHALVKSFLYSPGVRFFAQNAGGGAYWFLDICATEPAIRKQGTEDFALIVLTSTGRTAKIVVTDGNDDSPPVFEQEIHLTDCPEGEWKFYYADGIMVLPSER